MNTTAAASAQPRLELADPQAYIRRQVALVGDRNSLEILAQTPDAVDQLIAGRDAAALQRRPFEGKWTPGEIIGHLIDVEWTYGFRARMIVAHDRPALLGMDQDLWVAAQRYSARWAADLAKSFRALRGVNLDFWRALTETELDRFGEHAERGQESLRHIRALLAGHDLWHLDQLKRYVEAAATMD